MNSREKILATLNHEKSDELCSDFGGTRYTGITVPAMYRLRQCLDFDTPTRMYDVYNCLAETDDAMAEMTMADVLRLPSPVPLLNPECLMDQSKKRWKPYALEDGTPVLVPNDYYPERELNGDLCLRDHADRRFALLPRGDFLYRPLTLGAGAAGMTVEQLNDEIAAENPAVFTPKPAKYWEMLGLAASVFSKTSEKALILDAGPPTPFFAGLGRGDIPAWKTRLREKDPAALALLDRWLELWLAELEPLKAAVGTAVDIFVLDDDFSAVASHMGMEAVREIILPRYAEGIRAIRETISPDAKFLWQSPGNVTPLVPDLIAFGVDALGLVDLNNKNVNPLDLKQEFAGKITLWGGICSPEKLRDSSEEELRNQSCDALYALSRDGGFVLATSGNVLPDTPPENVLTFFNG